MNILLALFIAVLLATPAVAQAVLDLRSSQAGSTAQETQPPSVDAGLANGNVKRAGAPSVGDGRANGVVKDAGAPSVGDGRANGVVKSTTVDQ